MENRSIALTWRYAKNSRVGVTFSGSRRAPEIHELYSFGPHLATHTFDTGNANLKVESMNSLDLTWNADAGWIRLDTALFLNDANNFIFQRSIPGIFFDAEEGRFRSRCVSLDDCLPAPEGALAPAQGMSDAGANDGADPGGSPRSKWFRLDDNLHVLVEGFQKPG